MEISISELNSLCGVDCSVHLTDYANVFNRKYDSAISCSSLHDFHSEFVGKSPQSNIRFRGVGHSMHGRSLPFSEEKLISTSNMKIVKVLDEYTLEVDCGVQVGALNNFLNQYYCRLPVIHSGGHGGPSVAGYFLAGGIGDHSSIFGGFWSNVEEILWTDFSETNSQWYTQSDSRFWEISGSGGRLAGFLEKLRIRFLSSSNAALQNMPTYFELSPKPHPLEEPVVWWTIFSSDLHRRKLLNMMRKIAPRLSPFLSLVPPRQIAIKKVSSYPDFLKCFEDSLFAFSIGGNLRGNRSKSAYQATLLIEDMCKRDSALLVPYSSSELSSQSFDQS